MTQFSNDEQERFNNLMSVMEEYAEQFKTLYKKELEKNKASGRLINSVEVKLRKGNDYYSVTFSAEDYWKWVEEGRKSGKYPPEKPIAEWIRAKKIIPYPDRNGKLPTEQQLTFLIRRAIGEKGTIKDLGYDGTHYVAKTVDELNRQYLPLLEEALQEDFNEYVIRSFDNAFGKLKIW